MTHEMDEEQNRDSMPELIVWVSLCMLSAALGAGIGPYWQPIWVGMGLFGLATGVGLGAAEKSRLLRRKEELLHAWSLAKKFVIPGTDGSETDSGA